MADSESLSVDADDLGSHTLRAATQQGELPSSTRSALDEVSDPEGSDPDSPGESSTEPSTVDLTQNELRNGSLFDQPRKDQAAWVRHPLVKTNEADETLDKNRRAHRATHGKG